MEKYYKYGFFLAILLIIGLCVNTCSDQNIIKEIRTEESNLRKALLDSGEVFKTKEGNWGKEKLTIQTELSTLKDKNLDLTENQKKLVKEVERQNKTAQTFAAALIEIKAEIRGLKNDNAVVGDSSVTFPYASEHLNYNLTVNNVKPIEFKKPTLSINSLSFPNNQSINFHWKDDKKEGYPVSFSVVNTNPYFKVGDIQSYTIPEIKKEELKPTFWGKLNKFSKSTGGKILVFGLGFVAGAAIIQ